AAQRLGTTSGTHRFVWDLHASGDPALSSERGTSEGLWLPPGKYTVELTVAGEHRTQPLEVVLDPRAKLAPAAAAARYELGRRVEAARVEIAHLRTAVTAYRKSLPTGADGDGARARVDAISGGEPSRFGAPSAPPPRPSLLTV